MSTTDKTQTLARANAEKRRLQQEERAIREMMAALREQQTNLKTEEMELRAREKKNKRGIDSSLGEDEQNIATVVVKSRSAAFASAANSRGDREGDLGVGVLDQMMQGHFMSEEVE